MGGGVYFCGHERDDVVEARKVLCKFVVEEDLFPQMIEYNELVCICGYMLF